MTSLGTVNIGHRRKNVKLSLIISLTPTGEEIIFLIADGTESGVRGLLRVGGEQPVELGTS
ncbi:MAG: hypothetical protein DRQ08_00445 [Candidatus Latescibacterota bacterium]|nr:MAG: hypothetical protein DRQ08_00445 [Candidatus Latescibacterota bacterium]